MTKRWRVLFAGTPAFAIPSLQTLYALPDVEVVGVLTQRAKPHGRTHAIQESPVLILAREHGTFTMTPETLRTSEVLATLRALKVDVAVVVAYGLLVPPPALTIFPHGWVNVHGSLLPRWRGASPIQHAILAGDTETGVTLMRIDAGMDTGPTFAHSACTIDATSTSTSLAEILARKGAELLRDHLIPYLQDERELVPQPSFGVTIARKLTFADGNISFHRPAEEISRALRALTPWPGVYFTWNEKHIKILEARVGDGGAPIGKILPHPEGLAIGTADRLLVVRRVHVPGKQPVDAHAFLRGYPALRSATLP